MNDIATSSASQLEILSI